ncbi:DUF3800 domain-containing protein [Natronospora cellulosivora (SeqCode)]
MEFIIYSDESIKKGKYYSNFYGAALVSKDYFDMINNKLESKKDELNFKGEIKWSKVTANYLDKYKEIISFFFKYINENKIKIRIMFTQNCRIPTSLTNEQQEDEFFILYYQFLKHAFGFQECDIDELIYLSFYFDKLPDTKEKNNRFKDFIYNLQYNSIFDNLTVKIRKEDITEIDSHKHDIQQCMDIILGSIQFRLNDKHKIKPPGKYRRGKKTIAKEKLYKHINKLIREIYPNFNVGISTGTNNINLNNS